MLLCTVGRAWGMEATGSLTDCRGQLFYSECTGIHWSARERYMKTDLATGSIANKYMRDFQEYVLLPDLPPPSYLRLDCTE